jgi:hypothetical protein
MTTIDTDRLIQTLVYTAKPARPLLHPSIRGALWLAIVIPYIAIVVYVMSPRADLASKLAELRFLLEEIAALATGAAAAMAAFASTIPGYSRKVLLLPVLPLAVWLAALGEGCVSTWLQFGSGGLTLHSDWYCFPAIVLVGAIPAVLMVTMLRRGAPLTPSLTVALGGLAAAGLGNFGLRLFHPQDASLMVLMWQFGTVFVLTSLAASAGRCLLGWSALINIAQRRPSLGRPR